MIFDSHAHYDDEKFEPDRDELLLSLLDNNITKVVNVGATPKGCRASLELSHKYDFIYASLGIHPEEVLTATEEDFVWIEENLSDEKVVAVGEIGLDYNFCDEPENIALQKEIFIRQLKLARKYNMPVIIHSRDACEDTMNILREYGEGLTCVIHCFSYSREIAEEYVKMGYYIGVGGVVTFKNSKRLVETVTAIPIDRILLETDCPYMAPEPNRGKRNDSTNLKYVSEKIAQIKGLTSQEVEDITLQNTLYFYRINK